MTCWLGADGSTSIVIGRRVFGRSRPSMFPPARGAQIAPVRGATTTHPAREERWLTKSERPRLISPRATEVRQTSRGSGSTSGDGSMFVRTRQMEQHENSAILIYVARN